MKVRAMRVRARPGQRLMVAKRGYLKALDAYAKDTVTAMVDAQNNFKKAVNEMFREIALEAIRPVVAAVVRTAAPNENAIGGPTTSSFAARKWSGQP